MINLVTGAPGSGKSYYAVRVICEAVMAGKPVATNIDLNPGWERRIASQNPLNRLWPPRRRRVEERLRRLVFVSADLDELFAVRVPGTKEGRWVLVLDECHNWMNARTWNADETGKRDQASAIAARLRVVRFFTQHRKVGADVYAITQDAANIDRQVRTLFEHHIKLKALHNFKFCGVRVVPCKMFLAIWQWNDGAKTILKRQMYPLTGVRKIYNTMALSHGMGGIDDAPTITLPSAPADVELARLAVRDYASDAMTAGPARSGSRAGRAPAAGRPLQAVGRSPLPATHPKPVGALNGSGKPGASG